MSLGGKFGPMLTLSWVREQVGAKIGKLMLLGGLRERSWALLGVSGGSKNGRGRQANNEKYMNFGWCGAPGTPFEPYFALSLIDKNNLKDDNQVQDFIETHSYKLNYDQKLNPCNFAEPDDLTPDRYMKYGILNCPNARNSQGASQPDIWKSALQFIKLYDPLKYEFT